MSVISTRTPLIGVALLLLVLLPDTGRAQDVEIDDSAGVTIITTLRLPEQEWSVGDDPHWIIGTGPAEHPFYEVVGLVAASKWVAIANGGGHEILVYRDGRFDLSVGRSGGGPGEFQHLSGIGRYRGDSIYAYDYHESRLSIFDVQEGEFVRSFQLGERGELGGYGPRGTLNGGRFFLTSDAMLLGGPGWAENNWTHAIVMSPDGEPLDTLGQFPKSDMGVPPGSLVFGPRAVWAARGDRVYWSYGSDFSIRQYDPKGNLVQILRVRASPFVVSEDRWEQWMEQRLASVEGRDAVRAREMRALMRQELEGAEHAALLPSFDQILLDDAGRIWVREHPMAGVRDERWLVFDAGGRCVAVMEMPDRFRPFEIHDGKLIGVQRDTLDVEKVVAYQINQN